MRQNTNPKRQRGIAHTSPKRKRGIAFCFGLGAFLCFTAGCTSSSRLATCQAEKEQLLTTIRGQRDSNRELTDQVASLESRLDQAEKELARAGGGTRLSVKPSDIPPTAKATTIDRGPVPSSTVRSDSLPWRSPAKTEFASTRSEVRGQKSEVRDQKPASSSLLDLARRDRRMQYDAASRAAKLDLPISFDKESAGLTAEDKRQLDELARLLKSDDARELRVMVAGSTVGRPSTTAPKEDGQDRFLSARQLGAARAQAVADYLDRHGIAQQRLAVTASGTPTRGASEGSAASNGVQIYLLDSDAPVVGWSSEPIRR
jgi:outer membrane protein OmpA-like peptidoglycan-associated protein